MPKCKNDPSRNYKGDEPSPKGLGYCAHAEEEGKIMKGKNKEEWIIKKLENGSKRWIKYIKEYDLFVFHKTTEKGNNSKWPKIKIKKPKGLQFGMNDWVFEWFHVLGYTYEDTWNVTNKSKKEVYDFFKKYYQKYYNLGFIEKNIIIFENRYPRNMEEFKKGKKYVLKKE